MKHAEHILHFKLAFVYLKRGIGRIERENSTRDYQWRSQTSDNVETHIWRVFGGRERMDIRRRAKSCWHLQETKLKLRGIAQLEVHIQCIFILLNSPNKSVILLTFLLYMDYHGVKKKRRKKRNIKQRQWK